jgi:lipoprotein-anchoring transpeptidase ErfK/SrfK
MEAAFRAAVAALVLVPVALIGLGAANVAAFNTRAVGLEQSWATAESAGVAPAQLAPARARLEALRERKIAFLPYSIFSGALLLDPFGESERMAASVQSEALASARTRAQDDLARLKDVGGPNYAAYPQRAASLARARQLADYVQLIRAWEPEAKQLGDARDALSAASGGLKDGLPQDVMDGVSRLQAVVSVATNAKLSTEPGAQALAHAQDYLKQQYPQLLAEHDAVATEVRSAGDAVQHRVDLRTQADQLVGRLPDLLGQATKYNVASSYQTRAAQAKSEVLAAEQAGDDSRMGTATVALKQSVDQLSTAVTSAQKVAMSSALATGVGCVDGAPAQLIVIRLGAENMTAYNNGCPFFNTLTTSGRPAMRSYTGTFTIHAKYVDYLMHSPWQPSTNPLWYPDTVVHDAMLISPVDGVFIHSADWEPPSAYGPGSQNGPYASHGCFHVQNGPLATLYGWAQVGATVMVIN